MVYIALAFAVLAAGLHVIIFVFESVLWTQEPIWRRFKLESQDQAEVTRPLAFNQGFYNLFLAIVSAIGIIAICLGHRAVGAALIFAGVGSMLAAAAVLLASSPDKARAAITQGAFPLVAVVLLAVAVAT